MSDFGIRETGAAAVAWKAEIQEMKPGLLGGRTTQEDVGAARQQFKSFFDDNIAALKTFVPVSDVAKFEAAAGAHLDRIMQSAFQPLRGEAPVTKAQAHTAMVAANTEARTAIADLAKTFYGKTTQAWDTSMKEATTFMSKGGDAKVSTDTLGEANQKMQLFLNAKLDDIRRSVPPDQLKAFDATAKTIRADARETFKAALDKAGSDHTITKDDLHKVMRDAHIGAQRALIGAREQFSRPDLAPQIMKGSDGITLMRKAPGIENLVMQGGGAKGVGNPPAMKELAETGLMEGVKQIVGTSAGALTASVFACGMSTDDFETLMDKTQMTVGDKVPGFDKIYPNIHMDVSSGVGKFDRWAIGHAGGGTKDLPAERALQLLDRETSRNVGSWVDANAAKIATAVQDGLISAADAKRLEVFQGLTDASFTEKRSGKMVTFNDLAILHKLEPAKFKLTLTAFDRTSGEKHLFNKEDNPQTPIAYAGRMSMSIPVYFQAVNYKQHEYVDGGVISNVSTEAVMGNDATWNPEDPDVAKQEVHAKTMVVAFDDKGKAFAALHGRDLEAKPLTRKEVNDVAMRVVRDSSGADAHKGMIEDMTKLYGSGPNVHVVFHGDVDTFDLSASDARKEFAKQTATLRTLEQIETRQNQAEALTVEDAGQAMTLLTHDEKVAFAAKGAPTAQTHPRESDLKVARELYLLCQDYVTNDVD